MAGGAATVAGDCPEAGAVKHVTDANANAIDVVMSVLGIDTWGSLPKRKHKGEARRLLASEEPPFDQQSVTERARPASLVSLYLLFISFAVWASANTVSSKLIRCLDAISLLAIW